MPREFINDEGNGVTQAMVDYVTPLMQGEVEIKIAPDGLPEYTRFQRHNIEKKCPER